MSLATINDNLSAIGTGRANNSVIVNPYSSGTLTEIAVTPGSRVEAGSVIARLNSETEEIAVDRAKIALGDAQSKRDRMKMLSLQHGQTVQVRDAEIVSTMPGSSCATPSSRCERRSIRAPIDGIVGILPVEVGDQVTNADPDRHARRPLPHPRRLPGARALRRSVKVGAPVSATPIARPRTVFQGAVSAGRQPGRRGEPHAAGAAPHRQLRRPLRAGMSF